MKTLSYIKGNEEEITIGNEYYFGQIWDGDGDGEELLESGSVSPDDETVIAFEIVTAGDSVADTVVEITDIY